MRSLLLLLIAFVASMQVRSAPVRRTRIALVEKGQACHCELFADTDFLSVHSSSLLPSTGLRAADRELPGPVSRCRDERRLPY